MATDMQNAKKEKKKKQINLYNLRQKDPLLHFCFPRVVEKQKNSGHVNIIIRQVALVLELLVALLEKQEKNVAPSFMLLLLIFRGWGGLCSCFV
jgi:hypothetical protein